MNKVTSSADLPIVCGSTTINCDVCSAEKSISRIKVRTAGSHCWTSRDNDRNNDSLSYRLLSSKHDDKSSSTLIFVHRSEQGRSKKTLASFCQRTRRVCVHLYIYVYTNDLVKSTTDVACHVTIHFDTPPLNDAIKDTSRSGVKLKVYRYFQGALKLRDEPL